MSQVRALKNVWWDVWLQKLTKKDTFTRAFEVWHFLNRSGNLLRISILGGWRSHSKVVLRVSLIPAICSLILTRALWLSVLNSLWGKTHQRSDFDKQIRFIDESFDQLLSWFFFRGVYRRDYGFVQQWQLFSMNPGNKMAPGENAVPSVEAPEQVSENEGLVSMFRVQLVFS